MSRVLCDFGRSETSTKKGNWFLLDEKATLMQRSISVHRLNTFRHLLTDGATNEISRFDVISSNAEFKLSDSNVSIHFTNYNKFVESTESGASIRQENMFFVPNFGGKSPEKLLLPRVIMQSSVALKKDCRSDPLKKLLDRSKIQEQVSEPRCLLRSTNLVTLNMYEGYHAEKPLKIQISATLKQQLIVWENIMYQDKVQQGSAADGSLQANDIDGKKKIKRARSCY
ncbi:hypothetical protein YC2023_010412 [Brassica napus]